MSVFGLYVYLFRGRGLEEMGDFLIYFCDLKSEVSVFFVKIIVGFCITYCIWVSFRVYG